jgi:hypothetical protein
MNDTIVNIDNILLLIFCLHVQVFAVKLTVLRAGYNCTVTLGTSNI